MQPPIISFELFPLTIDKIGTNTHFAFEKTKT